MKFLLLYFALSLLLILPLLRVCQKHIKKESTRDFILKAVCVLTVFLHFSDITVAFLRGEQAVANSSHLFPIYPCHIMMWLSLIAAFLANKKGKLFPVIADFVFYFGTFCAIFGVVFNANYLNTQDLSDYSVLKGLVSHSTLLFACLYLYAMGYIHAEPKQNARHVLYGFVFLLIDGMFFNFLFEKLGLPSVNAMYLQELPFPQYPFINTTTIGVAGILAAYGIAAALQHHRQHATNADVVLQKK